MLNYNIMDIKKLYSNNKYNNNYGHECYNYGEINDILIVTMQLL